MIQRAIWTFVSICALPLAAQEVKPKPPLYSYVANWQIPREKSGQMEKQLTANDGDMKKHLGNGTIIGFGNDTTLVHQKDEDTHDIWWSAMSMAGLMKVLEGLKSSSEAPVLASGRHNDKIYVARYYNWRPGAFTNGYTRASTYKFKPGAPDDALDQMATKLIVPMFEKLLADGAIYEYEIDEEVVHSGDPLSFSVIVITNGPEGLDKAAAALVQSRKSTAFAMSAFDSWSDLSAHRDGLYHTMATYK